MSPRLPSASTSRPGVAAAWRDVCASASQPAAPRRSKQASCGLTATHAGPAASITARQCAATAAAARSAAAPVAAGGPSAAGPEPRRVGVEPEDDLGLARCDEARQPVAEARPGRRLVQRDCGRQLLTAFFSAAPALNFGDFDAAIWIFSPVRGCTPMRSPRCGDVELAEAGERHVAAALERVLDRAQHGVDGVRRPASWTGPPARRRGRRTQTSSRCAPPWRGLGYPTLTAISDERRRGSAAGSRVEATPSKPHFAAFDAPADGPDLGRSRPMRSPGSRGW